MGLKEGVTVVKVAQGKGVGSMQERVGYALLSYLLISLSGGKDGEHFLEFQRVIVFLFAGSYLSPFPPHPNQDL